MTLSERIYQILVGHTGPLSTKALAAHLGLTNDRRLRANGTDMGEIERAKAYAFRVHRRLIMTTHKGIEIVDDPRLAERMITKRYAHWANEQRSMNKDKHRIHHLQRESKQGSLFEG